MCSKADRQDLEIAIKLHPQEEHHGAMAKQLHSLRSAGTVTSTSLQSFLQPLVLGRALVIVCGRKPKSPGVVCQCKKCPNL